MTQQKSNGAAAATQETVAKSNGEILDDVLYQSIANKGDISDLSAEQKGTYLQQLCESLKLNPLTQPFTFLNLNGKLTPYANRSCTDQLAHLHNITREILKTEYVQDVYVVTCRASMPNGRSDISTGAVNVKNLAGDNLANALMKAETKAKRRAVLSICGLGFLDESELDTIPRDRMETVRQPATSRPATKGHLTNNDAAKTNGEPPATPEPQPAPPTQIDIGGLKLNIEKLAAAVDMKESGEKTIQHIEDHPEDAERAFCKAARISIKKLIEGNWPYTEDGTTAYLEKHGITVLDEASRGQLESLVDQLDSDGLLTPPAK